MVNIVVVKSAACSLSWTNISVYIIVNTVVFKSAACSLSPTNIIFQCILWSTLLFLRASVTCVIYFLLLVFIEKVFEAAAGADRVSVVVTGNG